MRAFVVDTNVAIVANGRETDVDLACQQTCVTTLRSLAAEKLVAIDDEGLILEEYRTRLHASGRPGVGDMFFKHVFDHQYQPNRVRRVRVSPIDDEGRGFEELPANTFDRSDRKFLAVAAVANAAVFNATDSDWHEEQALVSSLGVEVLQLCPEYRQRN